MNQLFYGDNLNVLREHIAAESVDLICCSDPLKSGGKRACQSPAFV